MRVCWTFLQFLCYNISFLRVLSVSVWCMSCCTIAHRDSPIARRISSDFIDSWNWKNKRKWKISLTSATFVRNYSLKRKSLHMCTCCLACLMPILHCVGGRTWCSCFDGFVFGLCYCSWQQEYQHAMEVMDRARQEVQVCIRSLLCVCGILPS